MNKYNLYINQSFRKYVQNRNDQIVQLIVGMDDECKHDDAFMSNAVVLHKE